MFSLFLKGPVSLENSITLSTLDSTMPSLMGVYRRHLYKDSNDYALYNSDKYWLWFRKEHAMWILGEKKDIGTLNGILRVKDFWIDGVTADHIENTRWQIEKEGRWERLATPVRVWAGWLHFCNCVFCRFTRALLHVISRQV